MNTFYFAKDEVFCILFLSVIETGLLDLPKIVFNLSLNIYGMLVTCGNIWKVSVSWVCLKFSLRPVLISRWAKFQVYLIGKSATFLDDIFHFVVIIINSVVCDIRFWLNSIFIQSLYSVHSAFIFYSVHLAFGIHASVCCLFCKVGNML